MISLIQLTNAALLPLKRLPKYRSTGCDIERSDQRFCGSLFVDVEEPAAARISDKEVPAERPLWITCSILASCRNLELSNNCIGTRRRELEPILYRQIED
jgi:hypothetical protein